MSETTKNSGTHWTPEQEAKLANMATHGKPTRLMAWELKRTVPAIYTKASELGISVKPTNQRPYSRPASRKR